MNMEFVYSVLMFNTVIQFVWFIIYLKDRVEKKKKD